MLAIMRSVTPHTHTYTRTYKGNERHLSATSDKQIVTLFHITFLLPFCFMCPQSLYLSSPSIEERAWSQQQRHCSSQTLRDTNSLRRTVWVVACSLLHGRSEAEFPLQPGSLTDFCENSIYLFFFLLKFFLFLFFIFICSGFCHTLK